MLTFSPSGRFTDEQMNEIIKATDNMFRCKCGSDLPRPYYNTLCWSCQREQEREKKRKWLVERKYKMTLEERIAFLEEWVYEHSNNHPKNIGDIYFK